MKKLYEAKAAHVTLNDSLDFDLIVSKRWRRRWVRYLLRLRLSGRDRVAAAPPPPPPDLSGSILYVKLRSSEYE